MKCTTKSEDTGRSGGFDQPHYPSAFDLPRDSVALEFPRDSVALDQPRDSVALGLSQAFTNIFKSLVAGNDPFSRLCIHDASHRRRAHVAIGTFGRLGGLR